MCYIKRPTARSVRDIKAGGHSLNCLVPLPSALPREDVTLVENDQTA